MFVYDNNLNLQLLSADVIATCITSIRNRVTDVLHVSVTSQKFFCDYFHLIQNSYNFCWYH